MDKNSSVSRVEILDRVTLEYALTKLTPMQRDIVLLYYWEDRSFEDIGKVIGTKYRGRPLSSSSMRYHIQLALNTLGIWMA